MSNTSDRIDALSVAIQNEVTADVEKAIADVKAIAGVEAVATFEASLVSPIDGLSGSLDALKAKIASFSVKPA